MTTDHMLFLTYTPRADSTRRGYHSWLRSTNTPFFNSVPGIAHYANWQVVGTVGGRVDWEYFDFLHIAAGATVEDIWSNERLGRFAANWTTQWAREPANPDLSVNYQIHEAHCVRAIRPAPTDFVAIVLGPDHARLPAQAGVWKITQAILGNAVQGEFAVVNLPPCVESADPAWGRTVLLAECIAKPDRYVTL